MGNSCRYFVSRIVDVLRTSVPMGTLVQGCTSSSSSSPPRQREVALKDRRFWILDDRRQYFLVDMIQGRFKGKEKYVAEVGKVGDDKTFILKKHVSTNSVRSECLALSITPIDNPHMLVAQEFFVVDGMYYFVFEKEDTDMFTIMSDPTFSLHRRKTLIESYIRQMVVAVEYMHSHRVIHYDLKFENMVVNLRTYRVRLIDFECCKEWNQPKYFLGTEDYMAPEILLHRSIRTYEPGKQDIWSLGILFAIMLYDKCPVLQRVRSAKDFHSFLAGLPVHPVVSRCLQFHPKDRVTIDQLVQCLENVDTLFTTSSSNVDDAPSSSPTQRARAPSSEEWDFGEPIHADLMSEYMLT